MPSESQERNSGCLSAKIAHHGIMPQEMPVAAPPNDRPPPADGTVFGVDPGLRRTGYAILSAGPGEQRVRLVEAGVVLLPSKRPLATRLVELQESLNTLIHTHRPTTLACEELYAHYRHPRTAILMAHARGVILALAARSGLRIVPVAATNAKKLLTGSGRASKHQVQRAVASTLGLVEIPEPHDIADAIAIALCGLRLRHAANVTAGALEGVTT